MILPSKHMRADRALIGVGASIELPGARGRFLQCHRGEMESGAPRCLEFLLQVLATALPVVPLLDQRRVSRSRCSMRRTFRGPAGAQTSSNRPGRRSCAPYFRY